MDFLVDSSHPGRKSVEVRCWLIYIILTLVASCGDGGVFFEARGMTTLQVDPTGHVVEPRGAAGEAVGAVVADAIVGIAIPDLPLVARGTISGEKVTIAELCIEIDLCGFYNDNELGVASETVQPPLILDAFASTFGGTMRFLVTAGDESKSVDLTAEDARFSGLTPIDLCPRQYCSSQPVSVTGSPLSIADGTFAGQITVEIDLSNGDAPLGGADVTASVPGHAPLTGLVDPTLGIDLVDLDLPL